MKNLKNVNEFFLFNKEKKDVLISTINSALESLKSLEILNSYKTSLNRENVYMIRLFINKDDEFGDGMSILYTLKDIGDNEYELLSFGGENLKTIKKIINKDLISDELVNVIKNDLNILSNTSIHEDGSSGGVAMSGTTSGMGNVVSAQPASTPGAAVTGDGTTGSGDYGNPLFPTAQKDGSKKLGKKKGSKKDKKKESVIANFIAQYKNGKDKNGSTTSKDGTTSSKMLSFSDFVNNDIKK